MRSFAPFIALLGLAAASPARAHGRPLSVDRIVFDPEVPGRVVLQATFGLIVSDDAGDSWHWICAAAFRADPVLENPTVIARRGEVVAGTFDGIASATGSLCEWSFPSGVARDAYVPELSVDAEGGIWGVASGGRLPDRFIHRPFGREDWVAVGEPLEDLLIESVQVSPSDRNRLYASGAPIDPGDRRAFVLASDDAGESIARTELTLGSTERFPLVLAVDPINPDRLFVRIVKNVTDPTPERLLVSRDGGASFVEIFALRELRGFAISADGETLYAASAGGDGLWIAEDAGTLFERANERVVRDVAIAPNGELWLSLDQRTEGFAVGVSTDGGRTIESRLRLQDVRDLPACPDCSTTGFTCPAWLDDLLSDQAALGSDAGIGAPTGLPRDAGPIEACGIDAGLSPSDGGVDAPPRSGCGCRIGPAPGAPRFGYELGAFPLFLIFLARRRSG